MSFANDPVPLLRDLIRIDTTNPPGRETECVTYLRRLLDDTDVDITVLGPDPDRANLVARFPGRGVAPPLLLHAHSDVVPVDGQRWTQPPFEARVVDGHIWGRGAIDMKGGIAMMLSALSRLASQGERPAGDVILAIVADEEAGSAVGARYLVNEHPELFDGVKYAVGEEGGAGVDLAGRRFHPIVVAEKRACWLRVTLRGPGGHGSRITPPDTPMARLGRLLGALSGTRMRRHQTDAADRMLATLADALPAPLSDHVSRYREDRDGDAPLAGLPPREALRLESVLRHTVNPTIVRTTEKINVVPSMITVDLDGRILPGGYTVEDFVGELRELVGADFEHELLLEGSMVRPELIGEPRFGGFYDTMAEILAKADPDGTPLPMVSPASTDARLFAQLGIRCYGWLPLKLPTGVDYRGLLHTADERVPVDALEFGTQCLAELLRVYR
jgi:acetylornithine deacetylase/succinyl-diaminopimelate desuccinylase-like protein